MLQIEALGTDPDQDSALTEIMLLVDMRFGSMHDGWNRESARLFAIDTAIMFIRRNIDAVSEADRQTLTARLQEARTLVVGDRDSELGFIQAGLESQLVLAKPGRERWVWLAAIDALLPSPFRAALVATRNAVALAAPETFSDLGAQLRGRLIARLGEGSLLAEPTSTLFLTA